MAKHELHYLLTGYVPGREDFLIQGGSLENVFMGPVPIFYIKTDQGVVLIDTSFHMDDAKILGNQDLVERNLPDEDPLYALEQAGIKPEDVSILILSHAHFDHVGYVDAFPNARVYIHQKELDWVMDLPDWSVGYGQFVVDRIQRVHAQLVPINQDRYEIVPGIEVIYVGGHSAGSLAILVDTEGGRVCLCADNIFLYRNIEENKPIGLAPNLYENFDFLKKLQVLGDIFIPGHDKLMLSKYPDGVIK